MRYEVNEYKKDGFLIYQLKDAKKQTTFEIIPEIGSNLISFRQREHSYISEFPSIKQMVDRVTCYQYGCATLYPPNRIKNATFTFKDEKYILPKNEISNHLHGDLCYKKWHVTENVVEPDYCSLTTEFRTAEHDDITQYYPHHLIFRFTYILQNGELTLNGSVSNNGDNEAPYALGFHPYFPLYKGEENQIELKVPAIEEWEIDSNAFVKGLPKKTNFVLEVNEGKTLENMQPLDVWLLSMKKSDQAECEISYRNIPSKLLFSFDSNELPYLVIFKPDWNNAISLEPYSYVTDAFNLPYSFEETGAKGIKPNEEITFNFSLRVED